jgi:transcription initiation factor TFIIIB Brf1 subunit/transcription initiation factor TFIIB
VLSAQGSDGKLTAREHSVVGLLDEMMRMDGYTEDQIFATAKMWYDYVLSASPNVVHAKTWAAAVEYAQAVSEDEPVTQASVAQKYKVSVSTLSQRYREILGSLSANR